MNISFNYIVILLCYIFCFANGFNDAANIIALPISTRVISPFWALFLACVFEFIGCYFFGSLVVKTIIKDIVDLNFLVVNNTYRILFATLFAASSWSITCTILGFPISSSHTLIGSMIGSVLGIYNYSLIKWINVLKIILVLIFAPFFGFIISYLLTKLVYILLFYAPKKISKIFDWLNILSICFFALSHGSNNGKKTVGLFMFCLLLLNVYNVDAPIPRWVILSCASVISFGILLGGRNVMKTVGMKIYKMKNWQVTISQFSASALTYIGSLLGLPLSTTHLIVGSIVGSGSADKVKSIKWEVSLDIFAVWVFTLPLNILLSYLIFKFLTFINL